MKDSSGDHNNYNNNLHVGYHDQYKASCPRGHWRPAEDEKLRQLVEQYGAQNWNSIAEKLQGRSGTFYSSKIFHLPSLSLSLFLGGLKLRSSA